MKLYYTRVANFVKCISCDNMDGKMINTFYLTFKCRLRDSGFCTFTTVYFFSTYQISVGCECHVTGCNQSFASAADYEEHYQSCHSYVCRYCLRFYPTNHLLEIHLLENHDSLFALLAKKDPMVNTGIPLQIVLYVYVKFLVLLYISSVHFNSVFLSCKVLCYIDENALCTCMYVNYVNYASVML